MERVRNIYLRRVIQYFFVLVGSAVYAAGFEFFMFPNSIVSGGVTGIAMIINYFTKLPVGVLTILLNIPLFLFAWRSFGREFMLNSLIGMAVSSAFVDIFAVGNIEIGRASWRDRV